MGWRLAPTGLTDPQPQSKRLRWTIRNLLVLTAVMAILVQIALQLDYEKLLFGKFMSGSSAGMVARVFAHLKHSLMEQWEGVLTSLLHGVIPIVVFFAPWRTRERLLLLALWLAIYWLIGTRDLVQWSAYHFGAGSLAVCFTLWLNEYRLTKRPRPASSVAS